MFEELLSKISFDKIKSVFTVENAVKFIPWKKMLRLAIKFGMAYAKEDVRFKVFKEIYSEFLREMLINAVDNSESAIDDYVVEKFDEFIEEEVDLFGDDD